MQKRSNAEVRYTLLAFLFIFGLVAAIVFVPYQFRSQAGSKKGLIDRTSAVEESLPNYDIRDAVSAKDDSVVRQLDSFRNRAGKNASSIAAIRDNFSTGENALRARVPSLKIEYNQDIRIPEMIGTDLWMGRHMLTSPAVARDNKHADILKGFLNENANLIGASGDQVDQLTVAADYTNPNGILSFVELNQLINGIPVFRGEVKAGFTSAGEMIRVINNFAPGLDYANVPTEFNSPIDAVNIAASNIKFDLKAEDRTPNAAKSSDNVTRFGDGGDWAVTAEKMYFPTEPGVARASWRVLIWEPIRAYYVIVDAETGTILWRKNLTNEQTQSATYNVWSSTVSLGKAMNSPAPLIPGPIDPGLQTQAPLGSRTSVTLIGNEGVLSFNNLGWITDGTNGTNGWTDGNAVQAGLDIDGTNGVDAPQNGTGRVFNFAYTPGNVTGGTDGGDDPTTAASRSGAVTHLFYLNNRYHDELYKVGFTEPARNYQNDNFGRGGLANDRVSAEAQDSSGTNNANFSIAADGTRGRMQMYRFTGPTPGRDGDLDSDVVFHEHTHGVSQRLIGNGSGLTTNRSGSSGEGWGDLFGTMLNLKPTDTPNSVITTGGYATYRCCGLSSYVNNYYYGIRREPYARISYTGGPSNLPFNNFTLSDIGSSVTPNSAYGCSSLITCPGNGPTEVHNAGEIWAVTGVEVWAQIADSLGTIPAAQHVLQLYTDGMKLSPLNPTFIQSRDAVIAAAVAVGGSDTAAVREGFRLRGMGFSATDSGSAVVEAFDVANVQVTDPFSVSDSTGNNNGVPEPGESVLLSIPVKNITGNSITNVMVNVDGGPSVNYGTIANGATVTNQIPYTISAAAPCGSLVTITINVSSSIGAQIPVQKSFTLGSPIGVVEAFDGVTAPALPAGWTTTQDSGTAITWATTAAGPDTAPNSAFANDPAGVNMSSLVSPSVAISSSAAQVKFRNKYNTESTFDGEVLEIKIGAGAWQDFITAGGVWVSGGYNAVISTGFSSPIAGRSAWSGASAGYIDTVGTLPAAANGQSVQFRWRMASDSSVASTGVNVDGVQIVSSYICVVATSVKSRADFDGDGKSDVSVFRSTTGDWYANRSTDGFQGIHWGATGDVIVPGDYDGDGKADFAIWRPSDTPNVTDFYVLYNSTFTIAGFSHGLTTDIPVAGDFDGDGKSDITVFRPSTGQWFVISSLAQTTLPAVQFGQTGDIPMAMDKDGDGKANFTVYRPSNFTFYMANAAGIPAEDFTSVQWGIAGDILVPADYDGDNKEDVAVYRPSLGDWYISKSTGGTSSIHFGQAGDIAVPGDYDGDGTDDIAVYRAGIWYMNRSTAGFAAVAFGTATDTPVEQKYHP